MIFTGIMACLRRICTSLLMIPILFFIGSNPGIAQETENALRKVDIYGQLRVEGSHILNEQNDTIALEGMSLFWSQWMGKYYNYDCVKWLRDDWHCEVVRATMAIEYDGYLKYPEREKKKIIQVIEASIDLGIYVIVDWHSHVAHQETDKAIQFFSEIARLYGDHPNIIYEIYNEPLIVSWDSIVKPYCDSIIAAIRQYDPDNIIIIGTPTWSQDVDAAAKNPILDQNIAYALHFYAGTHTQWLRDKANFAIDKGMAIWVSEFGTCEADGGGAIYYDELNSWFDYMESNKLSWCNWSVADKKETASIIKPWASRKGGWPESKLTESGKLIRNKLRSKNP